MRANFDVCLAEVLRHEGGYVNHPRDPGGETNMGISRRSYPNEDIRGMTRERAAAIYRRDFWDAVSGDDLPAGIDLVAFDAAVNSGPSRSAKWLQQALSVTADGKIGPKTIAAAVAADAPKTIARALDARRAFLRGLSTWDAFGSGWTRRIDSVRAAATKMAAAPTGTVTLVGEDITRALYDRLGALEAKNAALGERIARLEMNVIAGGNCR